MNRITHAYKASQYVYPFLYLNRKLINKNSHLEISLSI